MPLNEAERADGSSDVDSRRPYEFFVIHYVPDIVRGEFLNIGIVLREVYSDGDAGPRRAVVRITRDWSRVIRFFLDADLSHIQDMEDVFEDWLTGVMTSTSDPFSEFNRKLEQLSLSIQLTYPQACLAADINVHLALLMRMYVDGGYTSQPTGGTYEIEYTVREWFRRSMNGVRMRSEKYTSKGDPLVFDYLWKSEQAIHIVHALCIQENLDQALALVQRMDDLRRRVQTVEGKPLELTVVVELRPETTLMLSDTQDIYDSAVRVMREAGIRVITIADLPTLADNIAYTYAHGSPATRHRSAHPGP